MKRVALIMAGGVGKRLWPESTLTHPKQFLTMNGKESFLQATYRRASQIFGKENTYVSIRKTLERETCAQLPDVSSENIIIEPEGRDTAPCIGLASVLIKKRKGDTSMVVLPADHLIKDEEKFIKIISEVARQAEEEDCLVTIGIKPTRPEIGYGYLQIGEKLKELNKIPLYKVKRFTEKPSYKKAKEFFEEGNFLWNTGIFGWKTGVILKEIKKYLPQLYKELKRIDEASKEDEERVIKEVYSSSPKISIDYGVMEKSSLVVAVAGDFFWDDIGDWKALERIFPRDEKGNIIRGIVKENESTNCTLINRENKLMGTIGLSNLIVVNTKKGILIARKEEIQRVKDLIEELLKDETLRKYVE